MSDKADIHNQLQALISSCIDEGDYDPAEDYIKDPFCRRTMHTASLAINEIDTLRARVAELEADNADFKKLIADELAETFKLFGILDLNEADDFGTKTAIEAVRERIESIKADRDRWKAEAMAWREVNDTAQAVNRLLRVHTHGALVEEAMKTSQAALGIAKAARAANERGE